MRESNITVGHGSTLIAEARFYDDTYLNADTGPVLFILDAAVVRGPSGRERLRTKRNVIDFPDVDTLLAAVKDGEWIEAPVGNDPEWRPDVGALKAVASVEIEE